MGGRVIQAILFGHVHTYRSSAMRALLFPAEQRV